MKRFIGYFTEPLVVHGELVERDTPLSSFEFRADDWEYARRKFELYTSFPLTKPDGMMRLGLFCIPDTADDAAIERLTAEFASQWNTGNQNTPKLNAALKGGE